MYIEKRKEYDYDEYGSRWKEIVWFDNYQYIKDVKKDLDAIKRMMEVEFKNLSNEEFYDLISNFYKVYITKKEILDIVSKVSGVRYDKFERLNSRMAFKSLVTEGHGRDFSWWEETYEAAWCVATLEGFSLDPEYNYSKDEIRELVKSKKIVSFGRYAHDVGFDPDLPYEAEELEKIDVPEVKLEYDNVEDFIQWNNIFKFEDLKQGDTDFSKSVQRGAVSLLRRRLNKKRVLKDCSSIIAFLDENIHMIDDVVENGYYMDEGKKDEYLGISQEVTTNHKALSKKMGSIK